MNYSDLGEMDRNCREQTIAREYTHLMLKVKSALCLSVARASSKHLLSSSYCRPLPLELEAVRAPYPIAAFLGRQQVHTLSRSLTWVLF